jgi:hypothetical protein
MVLGLCLLRAQHTVHDHARAWRGLPARFLMITAITHHEFSSPSWGEHEVRLLHAELAELDRLAAQAVVTTPGAGRSGGGRTPA